MIQKIGNRFIEFSIDYIHHSETCDFMNPNKVINEFIENVARLTPKANGEFRLLCCIVNQSVVELRGRRLYTNSCFTTGIVEGDMNSRVKEFLYQNTKKRVLINGENGSNVYFYRFDFLKIHFLTSDLRQYINLSQD